VAGALATGSVQGGGGIADGAATPSSPSDHEFDSHGASRLALTVPITLNTILQAAGFKLGEVRLLRHQDQRSAKDRTPYKLWRDNHPEFERYQGTQGVQHESKLRARYWVSFVGTPSDETLFVGIYAVKTHRLMNEDMPTPHRDGVDKAGSCHIYDLKRDDRLADLVGKMVLDWGPGKRAWIQRPDKRDKPVVELRRRFREEDFPGFLSFVKPLSELDKLPVGWIATLKSSKGVYLLTCPRTKEQYVGSATGEEGFWGRWQAYFDGSGYGGNVGLKGREPSDYQVSILEVAGSSLGKDDIVKTEQLWKLKLQSREMGLNRN
jgi:hypothetical protein